MTGPMSGAPQSHDRGGENPPPASRCPVPPKPSLNASPVPLRTEVHFRAGFLLYWFQLYPHLTKQSAGDGAT